MNYYRKVKCPSLAIDATLEDQANALRLFTKLKDSGYNDVELLDHKTDDSQVEETQDSEISILLDLVK